MTFPADDVLIARGKYATLASERRTLLNALRNEMEAVADCARRVLRHVEDDISSALDSAEQAALRIYEATNRLAKIAALSSELEVLKPAAWPKTKETG